MTNPIAAIRVICRVFGKELGFCHGGLPRGVVCPLMRPTLNAVPPKKRDVRLTKRGAERGVRRTQGDLQCHQLSKSRNVSPTKSSRSGAICICIPNSASKSTAPRRSSPRACAISATTSTKASASPASSAFCAARGPGDDHAARRYGRAADRGRERRHRIARNARHDARLRTRRPRRDAARRRHADRAPARRARRHDRAVLSTRRRRPRRRQGDGRGRPPRTLRRSSARTDCTSLRRFRPAIVGLREGPFYASSDSIEITIEGAGGHGAAPHLPIDPIYVAGASSSRVQQIVSRQIDPLEPAVVTIGAIHAGTTHNVIPSRATLLGTVRAFDDDVRAQMAERIERVLRGVLRELRRHLRVRLSPALSGHRRTTPSKRATCARSPNATLGDARVIEAPQLMGAEDFSFFAERVPACFYTLGCNGGPRRALPHHHEPIRHRRTRARTASR